MVEYDVLIVGAGLFGSVLADCLSKYNKNVLIVEKESKPGGTVATENINGITVHLHGAHIFRTNLEFIWDYVNELCHFEPFINTPIAIHDNCSYNLPFNMNTFSKLWNITTPEEAKNHPARYALCEIENIHDAGIVFEPIHRVLFAKGGKTGEDIVKETIELLNEQNGKAYMAEAGTEAPEGAFAIPCLCGGKRCTVIIEEPSNKLEVGVLQNALDVIVKERGDADIDYIHGTKALETLSDKDGNCGFALPAMDKSLLFPAVAADGALPRKTFSMGEANEKRYYIESRFIGK